MDQLLNTYQESLLSMMIFAPSAKPPDEYDRHLTHLMQTASKTRIISNSSKCRIRQPVISFYSAVFTSQGMKSYPTKFQALLFAQQLNKASVLFRTNPLHAAIHPRSGRQDIVPVRATLQVGLEPFNWCSIPATKGIILQYPPEDHTCILWQMTGPSQS